MHKTSISAAVCVAVAIVAMGDLPASSQPATSTVRLFERLAGRELDAGVASVSAAFVRRDRVLWAGARGYENMRTRTVADADTVYSTASTFKPVVSAAVLRLVDSGELDLDVPVSRYLGDLVSPELAAARPAITLRRLLTHTAGLPVGARSVPLWSNETRRTLAESAAALRPEAEPGSAYQYSNPGYSLIALVVERVSGRSFEQFVLDEIFARLGIASRGLFSPTPVMVERMALPYLPYALARRFKFDTADALEGKPVAVPQVRFDDYPAGDAYARPSDMARFLGMLLNGGTFGARRILSEDAVASIEQPQAALGSPNGLGMFLVERHGRQFIEHSGGYFGYSAYLIGHPASGYGVFVAANSMGDMTDLAVELITSLIDENR